MGKKKTGGNLGKALIKDRFGSRRNARRDGDSCLHTSELNDGYDWGRLNLQSVTEESSFQEFLSTAELAGTEFQAEKLNVKFVSAKSQIGLVTETERKLIVASQEKNKDLVKIPRRPKWDSNTTAEELQSAEKEAFLKWRRQLANLQEAENLLLTPYEKNLEFWRQLWRVIERSDVIVQIVDARNPLLFRCADLEKYVHEVDPTKMNLILLNKADFLSAEQRQSWADHFAREGVRVAFFSATRAAEAIAEESEEEDDPSVPDIAESEESEPEESEDPSVPDVAQSEKSDDPAESIVDKEVEEVGKIKLSNDLVTNCPDLLDREQLIELFSTIYDGKTYTEGVRTIGLVGYPNVGKSSTINALMMSKKVSVSATPGKTKHFQTLYLRDDLLLCDCPGLVMPSFISTKSEMILNGILPIDQMKDHVPPMNLLGTIIPRHVIEDTYGILLPKPADGEDPDRPPHSEEILNAYGYNRGFMTQNGQPDNPRSSRYLLKDFVNGKLLYCVAPPGMSQELYHKFPEKCRSLPRHVPPATLRATKGNKIGDSGDVDRSFFNQGPSFHFKGKAAVAAPSEGDKPWKKHNKHVNKNKREKLRRVHRNLDLH